MTNPPEDFNWGGKKFRRAWEQLCRAVLDRTPLPGPGFLVTDQPGQGRIFKLASVDALDWNHPYRVYRSGENTCSIVFGTHGDIIPTVGGDPITDEPAPTMALSTGTNYIYAKLTTDGDGLVTEVDIDRYGSTQTDDDPNDNGTDGTFYQLLAAPTLTAEGLFTVNQNVQGSQEYSYCLSGMIYGLV